MNNRTKRYEEVKDTGKARLVFVAPSGDDRTGDGSIDCPFLTVHRAAAYLRTLPKDLPITVYLRGGEYVISEKILLSGEADSGTEAAPITYAAYPGETVRLNGGVRVMPEDIAPAFDAPIADRVLSRDARRGLWAIDMSRYLTEPIQIPHAGDPSVSNMPVHVFAGNTKLRLARYPASGYLSVKSAFVDDGKPVIGVCDDTAARMKLYSKQSLTDLYAFGYLFTVYNGENYKLTDVDAEHGRFSLLAPSGANLSQIKPDRTFYLMNLPEEISVPGDSYYDRDENKLYFLPPDDFSRDEVTVSRLAESMFSLSGVSHVNFVGLEIAFTRRNAFDLRPAAFVTIRDCTIHHNSWNGMTLFGHHLSVEHCTVEDTDMGGIAVSDADLSDFNPSAPWLSAQMFRRCLRPGFNRVVDCTIRSVNGSGYTYRSAIGMTSFGGLIAHNEISDCVHQAIGISSNDVTIEYNILRYCVTEASDMGAIYYGRDPLLLGTVIRYNLFEHIGNPYFSSSENGQFAIYIDDGASGADIYGNVFCDAVGKIGRERGAVHMNGSQHTAIHDNIFVNCVSPFYFTGWGRKSTVEQQQSLWMVWLFNRANVFGHSGIGPILCNELLTEGADSGFALNPSRFSAWENHYRGTMWEPFFTYITAENANRYRSAGEVEVNEDFLARKVSLPCRSNRLDRSVFVNVEFYTEEGFHAEGTDYPGMGDSFLSDDRIFADAAHSRFSLTEDGLAAIRRALPDFAPIPFADFGVRHRADAVDRDGIQ